MAAVKQNLESSTKNHLYSQINNAIVEYLQTLGLNRTMTTFLNECNVKSIPCPNRDSLTKSTFSRDEYKILRNSFDKGDLETFQRKWNLFLSYVTPISKDIKMLEVYVRVYFAIWPKIHGKSESEQTRAMSSLKSYFDKANELSNDTVVLPLFALPYVSDPKSHPVFEEFFKTSWTEKLKRQLDGTFSRYFEMVEEKSSHLRLADIVLRGELQQKLDHTFQNALVQYHEERFSQLMATFRKIRNILRGTRASYGKILRISSALMNGFFQASTNNNEESELIFDRTINECFQEFPELFASQATLESTELENIKPDIDYFRRFTNAAILNNIMDVDISLFFIGIADLGPESLNYPKIKEDLASDKFDVTKKLCLLQALRWLLTRKSTYKNREATINCYAEGDILGIGTEDQTNQNTLLVHLLTPNSTYVKECLARLLNTIASMKCGRRYLASNKGCLETLLGSLNTLVGENDSYICQMIIATLQKLSLRKEMRLEMINHSMIQWLSDYLNSELSFKQCELGFENKGPYTSYLMEYGWALLMNLCLHDEAKTATSSKANDLLTGILKMLQAKPRSDVAPYVVSTLYSLLRSPAIFEVARKINVQEQLWNLISEDTTEMSDHLKKLIDALNTPECDRIITTGEVEYDDDDNEDPEDFELEIEVREGWTSSLKPDQLIGDDLLMQEYLIEREVILPEIPIDTASIRYKPQNIQFRPTTPKTYHHSSTEDSQRKQDLQRKHSRTIRENGRKELPKSFSKTSIKKNATSASKQRTTTELHRSSVTNTNSRSSQTKFQHTAFVNDSAILNLVTDKEATEIGP